MRGDLPRVPPASSLGLAPWLLLTALTLMWSRVPTAAVRSGQEAILHEENVTVPMRDGVTLRADVLRRSEGRLPTLVYRTPYGRHEALKDYTTFRAAAEHGYAVVVQDVRGRYASDGEFRPYEQEGRDGYDTIEWAARQSWSNGRVGTFGLSYPGAVQWLAAVEGPPHLEAMVPAMTFSTPQNFFYSGGVWDLSWFGWIWRNIAPDLRRRQGLVPPTAADAAGWEAFHRRVLSTLPLDAVPELRQVAPFYYDWLHHPPEDPYWGFAELRHRYGRTRAAVLNLSGWHDDNYGPEGATTNYMGLVRARHDDTSRAALLVGPWSHGVDATARTRFGELEFGPSAAIDYDAVVLGWMDRHLRGVDTTRSAAPVRYFVMGENRWREAALWPPATRGRTYYLAAVPGERRGLLTDTAPLADDASTAFESDPADPVVNAYAWSAGAHDYRALTERPDVLTFDSDPLPQDVEVTGSISVRVFISCDCRDTDLWVRVLDVAPDGSAWNVMSPGVEVIRASYRNLERGRQLLVPGEVYELSLAHLVTSNLFRRGHRVRVQISASFFPNFSRNLHTGALETVSARMQRATIRVHHDRQHPSQVLVPVADR
jgi:putative CocE/NonD family hydrolase